jgi:hypothetical protein
MFFASIEALVESLTTDLFFRWATDVRATAADCLQHPWLADIDA